ncbi:MAG TPA: AraC family transcriptional regulator ligand-binding domain-containing protein [Chiayiivirga sp.]|nr:AraC family transcriptional regulator ligand-binding domain-containing protein [Chiayiivirga sp.]
MKELRTPQDSAVALPVQWNLRAYPATAITLLHDVLVEEGIDPEPVLAAAGLALAQAQSPDTRVSRQQVLAAYKAVAGMDLAPTFAFRCGAHMRLTYFGMYGFALMSAPDLRTMLQFSVEQQGLTAALVRLWAQAHDSEVALGVDPLSHVQIDARVYRFLVEMHFGVAQRAWCDLTGAEFRPLRLGVTWPASDSTREVVASLGAEARFAQSDNAFVFDAHWLDSRPQFGNLIAHDSVRNVCAVLSAQLKEQSGLAAQVGKLMVADYGRVPGIERMAATLGMSERELRRRLHAEGTSYREIHDDVRAQVAMKYLRDTSLPVESIAAAVGFNDAANFRRAFRRWTGKTPGEYRAATAPADKES